MNNWRNTFLTQTLNINLPIIQAPMAGGYTTPHLVAAVSNAGALGSLALGYLEPDAIQQAIINTRTQTDRPFAVNLFIPNEERKLTRKKLEQARITVQEVCSELNIHVPPINPPYAPNFDEQMDAIIASEVPIFSFTFGIPSNDWLQRLKSRRILTIGTATTLAEVNELREKEIDIVVVQGVEAGGHRGSFLVNPNHDNQLPLNELLSLSLHHKKMQVVAAGGIMNGSQIAELILNGASGVQMGTAFLCCEESGIHPAAKKLILNNKNDYTTFTRAFSGKLARGITNQFILRMQKHEEAILDYPLQNALTSPMRKEAARVGNTQFMSIWAGKLAHLCQSESASFLIRNICKEIDSILPS